MVKVVTFSSVANMMIFNYRYVPALGLIKKLLSDGKIGTVFHFNAVCYQDWLVNPLVPVVWRHSIEESVAGANGDMNAHVIDIARFLIGEFESVCGMQKNFITQRPQPGKEEYAMVSTDDACCFQSKLRSGARLFHCDAGCNGAEEFFENRDIRQRWCCELISND